MPGWQCGRARPPPEKVKSGAAAPWRHGNRHARRYGTLRTDTAQAFWRAVADRRQAARKIAAGLILATALILLLSLPI